MNVDEWLSFSFESFINLGYLIISNGSDELSSRFEKHLEELHIGFYVEHDFDYITFHKEM
ncbi:hypothetical protein SAMN04487895_101579 [Paenibacillus sophorae]|uniref:Uncharacterized protein n=1 Tax=Paenibacillus sophorae TaxID=1333845 RepID=A0A1H8GPX3_9BACL|nr:hypothetical protein SAMN04487895_101579 [Paenibacillus sophorae]